MAKLDYSTTIAIDAEHSVFHFYSMMGNDKSKIAHYKKSYGGEPFSEEFFAKFKKAVAEFAQNTPSDTVRKVTVVLPDSAVLTDTVKVPTLKGNGQTQKALDVTFAGIYRNYQDLQVVANIIDQNKQYSTFAVTAVQKSIVSAIYAACSENKLLVDTLTYESCAAVGGAITLNPRMRSDSYLFLDIKDVYSHFAFVVNGYAVGYYKLPFGLEFLKSNKVAEERSLFDHSYAELVVINSHEKARSQNITVESDDEEIEEADDSSKSLFKKSSRSKNTTRDADAIDEEIAYENFRVFIKWALLLLESNDNLTALGKPEYVCVNIPAELESVIEKANDQTDPNGIAFTRLPIDVEDVPLSKHLELYGGLFPRQISPTGKL